MAVPWPTHRVKATAQRATRRRLRRREAEDARAAYQAERRRTQAGQ